MMKMTLSKPYNLSVSIVTLNRILIILGVLGMFVAGVLTVEHIFQLEIPCTTGGGCETVARHPLSYVMGVPVAYFGLGGYILLTAIAIVRGFTGQYYSRFLTLIGYGGAAFGTITSLYLQFQSLTKIHALCIWCITSALIMVITFVFYTILFGRLGGAEVSTEPVSSSKTLFQSLAGVAVASLAVVGVTYGRNAAGLKIEVLDNSVVDHLVPEPRSARNQLGPDDAPITIIEYADLCCPQCRKSFPKIHELIAKYPGKIRVIYRHFPIYTLAGHEMSLPACIASELAGSKGKFWVFADAFTSPEEPPKSFDGVVAIAKAVGVTSEEITAAQNDEKSEAQTHIVRDFIEARTIFHIDSTPTFLMYTKGQPVKKLPLIKVINELETPEYQKLLK
jgi:uncharacterized membrane protein/thiol-disulfide isomerase/thioredoxin